MSFFGKTGKYIEPTESGTVVGTELKIFQNLRLQMFRFPCKTFSNLLKGCSNKTLKIFWKSAYK